MKEAAEEQKAKRKRRIDSCRNCRLRKVRCDQRSPCQHCIRRGESTSCTYEDQQTGKRWRPDRDTDVSVIAELERLKARLERVEAQGASSDSNTITTSPQYDFSKLNRAAQNNTSVQEWQDWSMYRHVKNTTGNVAQQGISTSFSNSPKDTDGTTIEYMLSLLPTRDEAKQLIEDNNRRLLKTIFGNVVHMPAFRKEVETFYDEILAKESTSRISLDWLALFFSFILLAITHPSRFPGQYPSQMTPDTTLLMPPDTPIKWYNAALSCLSQDGMRLRSICALQAIILLDFYEADAEVKLSRLRSAITGAQLMGLHRLGPDSSSGTYPIALCEREIQKRIWWCLVVKDWNGAVEEHGYIVQPSLCSTPHPCNYDDEDLSQSYVASPRSLEEHTHMSSMLNTIKLSSAIRQHGDRLQQSLCQGEALSEKNIVRLGNIYLNVWETTPIFYRLAVQNGYIDLKRAGIMVQSWMLQQGVFHKLLDLHSSSFSSRPGSFEACFDLAKSILTVQSRIRTTCSLVDQLWVNLAHSFSSAVVLCIGLFHQQNKTIKESERQAIRTLVGEALSTFDFINAFHANAAIRMQRVVQILLDEEQKQYGQGSSSVIHRSSKGDVVDGKLLTIVAKVVREVLPSAENKSSDAAKTARPHHGILQPGFAEPNGVKLGHSTHPALPEVISRALNMLNDSEEGEKDTPISKPLPDLYEQQLGFVAGSANIDAIEFELPSTSSLLDSSATSSLNMSQESDGFWSWLLNEDLLMLGGPSAS